MAEWDQRKEETLGYLRLAIANGKNPQRLAQHSVLKSFISFEEFTTMSQNRVSAKTGSLDRLLWMDPIDD